jgi:LEA14-like dessication related protein
LKRFAYILLVLVLVLAVLWGYFHFYPEKARNLLVPSVKEIKKVKARLTSDSAFIDLALILENKGIFTINIDSARYQVFFDSLRIMKASRKLGIRLPPGTSSDFTLPLRISIMALKKGVMMVQERDSAMIYADLQIVYSTIFGQKTLPYEKITHIPVPRIPEFSVDRIKFKGIRKGKFHFLVTFRLKNRGSFSFDMKGFDYDLKIKDRIMAKGRYTETIPIKAHATVVRDLPVEAEFSKIPSTLIDVIRNKDNYPYTIKLNAMVQPPGEEKPFPIELIHSGSAELKK